jgi:hypothetical protein
MCIRSSSLDHDDRLIHGVELHKAPCRRAVAERCGNATVAITRETYSHAIPGMPEEASTLIAVLVLSAT